MAEVKNTFLNSKMNLDLDDRLIPNGQYRQAFNIAVGRSEDEDVGALENIPGNILIAGTDIRNITENPNIDCIGVIPDNNNNRIILFLTDFNGTLGNYTTSNNYCAIWVYSFTNATYKLLVEGSFLNFSKANPIYGVNLIEDLLFWTDNRNQPRKINITTASNNSAYYTNEVQISVAKYNPYETISLIKTVNTSISSTPLSTTVFDVTNVTGIELGMTLICAGKVDGNDYIYVTDITGNTITIDSEPTTALSNGDAITFLISTMTNENSNSTWPGDPDYLQSRYVRFGYRFKFDDSEYSITSPFSQIAYIPEQKGYFIAGDEDAAYRSTVLNFMQNNVQNVDLLIPLPDKLNNIQNSYKITEIDILYKQADQTTIKVLDTIVISEVDPAEGNVSLFNYNYQSRKPYKTLPEAQTVRVYDKVPTRAFAQETSGNRIIYGNYKDVYTPPNNINYTVAVTKKATDYVSDFNSFIEYPNHTLKENRNYQVGFVLCDKYGRQSPVILSSIKDFKTSLIYGGSTVYSPYKTEAEQPNMNDWVGDVLQVSVNTPISSGLNNSPNFATGEPGLYAIPSGSQNGFSISSGVVVGNAYSFVQDGSTVNDDVPSIGNYLRGKYKDYVKVISVSSEVYNYDIITDGPISDIYNYNIANTPDIKFSYNINEIGWYSYKVVVKQTEQDYYNCYLPGMLNGYPVAIIGEPVFPTNEDGKTSHIILLNDNINKIPRDLSEVGPDQKQYRSSVVLYGRVQNNSGSSNEQYYPGRLFDVVSTIANATELNMDTTKLTPTSQVNIYQVNTKPIIGRVSTSNVIGVTTTTMLPFLSIYETKPVESLLTIYWETSTNGLLSDLNENVLTGYNGPFAFSDIIYLQTEDKNPSINDEMDPKNKWVTDLFVVKSKEGATLSTINITSFSVINGLGENVTSMFGYEKNISAELRIKITQPFTYLHNSHIKDVFVFSFVIDYIEPGTGDVFTNTLATVGSLVNKEPSYPINQWLYVDRATDIVGAVAGGVNGSFANTNSELYWVLDSITGPSIAPTPFLIDSNTGIISQTNDSLRAFGTYTLGISIYDATISDGTHGIGYLSYSGYVNITIGEVPLNAGIPNSDSPVFCDMTDGESAAEGRLVIAPSTEMNNYSTVAAWFVGNSDVNTTTLPSTWTSIPSGKKLNAPYVMGSNVTQGTLGLTIASQIKIDPSSGDYPISSSGYFQLKVYHRTNSSDVWTENFMDINNRNFSSESEIFQVLRLSGNHTESKAITRAYNLPGEYFIMVWDINTSYNNPPSIHYPVVLDTMHIWVNAFDLFYSNTASYCQNCVIGSQVSTTSWAYVLSTGSTSRNCTLSDNTVIYTNTPYLPYARSFYKDIELLTPIDSPVFLSATPDLYYSMRQNFDYGSDQSAFPTKGTLQIDVNGNKIQTNGLEPYAQFCDNIYNDYIITTIY